MTNRERENATLDFQNSLGRGAVEETFFPWKLTVDRFKDEGLPLNIYNRLFPPAGGDFDLGASFFDNSLNTGVYDFEQYMGFDPVKRIHLALPFRRYKMEIIEDHPEYIIRLDYDGRQRKYYKNRDIVEEYKHAVSGMGDWQVMKERANKIMDLYFTDEIIQKTFEPLQEGHIKGDYSIRMNIEGFFWTSRELLGIEPQLYAFFDKPDLIHNINEYILKIYLEKLVKIMKMVPADVLYIMEDLSGANGPMISPAIFDEFVGSYYKRLIPALKEASVKHIFVDTDGDFRKLIPNFISAGVEGFLPMDVNAGMDIVAVREDFPKLKFIGGFNKLCIAAGKESIDQEFRRIMPVIRQGGYIPGCDHQVAPSTSLDDYKYYIQKLSESMKYAGVDH